MKHTWQAKTPIQCNRCYAKFILDHEVESGSFSGGHAARISSMERCPLCETTDAHWVLAVDVAPDTSFPGLPQSYLRNRAALEWRRAN